MASLARTAMIAGGRLLVLFHFSPRTGLTVIDPKVRRVLNGIEDTWMSPRESNGSTWSVHAVWGRQAIDA